MPWYNPVEIFNLYTLPHVYAIAIRNQLMVLASCLYSRIRRDARQK